MKKIIDLTYNIEKGMLTFDAPWHPPVLIQQLGRINVEGRETRKISFGTHTGTHIDAPLHFIRNGKSVEQISLEKLIGNVTIVDFSNMKKNQALTKDMLKKIKITKRMLFKFGWGNNWNKKNFYKGYPYFTKEAAEFLVSKKVELLAYDTPSPDDSRNILGSEGDSPVHRILLQNGIILVEYVANLEKVTNYEGWKIVVAPLKVKKGDGSPSRVFIYQ